MKKFIKNTLIIILLCAKTTCFAQALDSMCNHIYEGYIVRIFERCDHFTACRFDVLFFEKKPDIKQYANDDYPDIFLDSTAVNNCWLLNEKYYDDFNAPKIYTSYFYKEYCMGKELDSFINKKYTIRMYRVIVAGFLKTENLISYASHNMYADKYSGFKDLKNEEVLVLYPSIISIW